MADNVTVKIEWGEWKKFYKEASNVVSSFQVIFDTVAKGSQDYMKRNAPWTDRTSMARKTINATSGLSGKELQLTLAHGMWYGVYLELSHQKSFAIIKPTMDKFTKPELEKHIQDYYKALSGI